MNHIPFIYFDWYNHLDWFDSSVWVTHNITIPNIGKSKIIHLGKLMIMIGYRRRWS